MTLAERIHRLCDLNAQRKAIVKEEGELKAWFKQQAGKVDMNFEHDGRVVKVTWGDRSSIVRAKLLKFLTEGQLAKCVQKSRVATVTCGDQPDDEEEAA